MSEKVSANDWISAALKALAADGFTAVKADILAKTLGVSRGSFYWHFENIDKFHLCVMQRWQEIATDAIILRVEGSAKGTSRLRLLIRLALTADSSLETGMRAWGSSFHPAMPFIQKVDQLRLNYIERLILDAGLDAALARTRARIIYWTYLGSIFSDKHPEGVMLEILIDQLSSLAFRDGDLPNLGIE
jgi:AcrR family transcriptional regulator